jgi:hypothetical protein
MGTTSLSTKKRVMDALLFHRFQRAATTVSPRLRPHPKTTTRKPKTTTTKKYRYRINVPYAWKSIVKEKPLYGLRTRTAATHFIEIV